MRYEFTREELKSIKEEMKKDQVQGFIHMWKILEPDWDNKKAGEIDPSEYVIPHNQALDIMRWMSDPGRLLWLNNGPSSDENWNSDVSLKCYI